VNLRISWLWVQSKYEYDANTDANGEWKTRENAVSRFDTKEYYVDVDVDVDEEKETERNEDGKQRGRHLPFWFRLG